MIEDEAHCVTMFLLFNFVIMLAMSYAICKTFFCKSESCELTKILTHLHDITFLYYGASN